MMNFNRYTKVIPKFVSASEEYTLTKQQLDFYNDNGYVVIPRLFCAEDLEKYKSRFVELCNGANKGMVSIVKDKKLYKQKSKPEDYINKIQEILYDDVFKTYSENPALLNIVSQLIGEDLTAINCMLINKPPGTPRHPPHQDLYYFPIRPAEKIVGVWTAVDPVYMDNGCLYMLPGSHKAKVLYKHDDNLKELLQFFYEIVDEEIVAPVDKRIHLIMDPGDTVIFSPYIVHGSEPNVSNNYRKAMTCHYANSHCQYIDVKGSPQELLATQIENELRRRGADLTFADLWRVKSKQVKGVRSNL